MFCIYFHLYLLLSSPDMSVIFLTFSCCFPWSGQFYNLQNDCMEQTISEKSIFHGILGSLSCGQYCCYNYIIPLKYIV